MSGLLELGRHIERSREIRAVSCSSNRERKFPLAPNVSFHTVDLFGPQFLLLILLLLTLGSTKVSGREVTFADIGASNSHKESKYKNHHNFTGDVILLIVHSDREDYFDADHRKKETRKEGNSNGEDSCLDEGNELTLSHYDDRDDDREHALDDFEDDENFDDDAYHEESINDIHWDEQQIEEMEQLYERYRQHFHDKFGNNDACQTKQMDSKEVVYSRYLKFLESEKQGVQQGLREDEESPQRRDYGMKERKCVLKDSSDHKRVVIRGSVPDNVIPEPDPYFLESEWIEFNEWGHLKNASSLRK